MSKRLRLTEPSNHAEPTAAPETGKVEVVKAVRLSTGRTRDRLVAGRVESDPRAEAPAPGREGSQPRLRLRTSEDDAPLSTPHLIGQIERALDRMQDRLREAGEQIDGVLKFPSPARNDWPPRPPRAA